jgi:uncharacterized protein
MVPTAVVIMAKAPQAGAVKTRLCPPLAPQTAAALYHAFLLDKIAQVRRLVQARPAIAYTPEESKSFFAELAPDFLRIPQHGTDLGERLINSFVQCFAAGYTGVLAIDSDTPTLPTDFLQQAVALIATPENDVVLGPTEDGGYYLIGLRAMYRELFDNMAWSTAAVLHETRRRAVVKGLKITCLPPWFDVDTAEDLQRLQTVLTQTTASEPRYTRQFFLEHAP